MTVSKCGSNLDHEEVCGGSGAQRLTQPAGHEALKVHEVTAIKSSQRAGLPSEINSDPRHF